MRRRAISATIAIAVLAVTAACGDDGGTGGPPDPGPATTAGDGGLEPDEQPAPPDTDPPPPTIAPSSDCSALLDHYQTQALEHVGPYGLGDVFWPWGHAGAEVEDAADGDMAVSDDSAGALPSQPADREVSDTNVQVEGVDEADRVKTDGEFIYVLTGDSLRIVEPAPDGVTERGRVRFEDFSGHNDMFLDGDTIVAIGNRWQAPTGPRSDEVSIDIGPGGGSTLTELMEIDVSDPDDPIIVRSLIIDGTPVASRLSNGVVRLVIESGPVGIEWETPKGSGLRAELDATEANRELIRNSTIENWLPYAILDEDGELGQREIIRCEDVFVPSLPAGYNTLSVMQVPVGNPLGEWNTGGVVASGAEVYAPADELYVATIDWNTWDEDDLDRRGTTSIHRFETPSGGAPRYVATGQIEGRLLNQFSMDAFGGHLRVATTSGSPWGDDASSESQVVVLRQDGDELIETGRVGELGKTETIHAVRFTGEAGYVVTFRQTDPLYVLDLSDPDNPSLDGELKIPGFSNYLHPAADGFLVGVGQDADEETGWTEGLQISLFDVTDPLSPQRVDTYGIEAGDHGDDEGAGRDGDSSSPVQWDHRAFTEHRGEAFIPFSSYSWSRDESTDRNVAGFLVVPLDATDLSDARTIVTGQQVWGRDIDESQNTKPFIDADRGVGIDNRLYGLGYEGIVVIDLDDDEVIDRHRWGR